jgi:hypothetical protein
VTTYIKDPSAELDYAEDFSQWLLTGDSISTATWTVPNGLTQPQTATLVGAKATVWLGGGTLGQEYTVSVHVVTAQGRKDDRSFTVGIQDR